MINEEIKPESQTGGSNGPHPLPPFTSIEDELAQYVGNPKCMDCKWKLGSDITNNCGCTGVGADPAKYKAAFDRARELQAIVMANT